MQNEKNRLFEFFNQSIASFLDFDVQQSKCFFFEIVKIFDVSNLNCFFQTVRQIEPNLFDRIHINSIFNSFDEKINVFIINVFCYLNHVVEFVRFVQNEIKKFDVLRSKKRLSIVIVRIIIWCIDIFLRTMLFLNKLNIDKTIFWMFCWNKLNFDDESFSLILFCSFSFEFIEVSENDCDVLNEKWCFENENNDCEFFNFWILNLMKFRLNSISFEFFDCEWWFVWSNLLEFRELSDFFSTVLSIFIRILNFQWNFDFIDSFAVAVLFDSNFSFCALKGLL